MKESFYFLFFLHVLQLVGGARITGFNYWESVKLATTNIYKPRKNKVSPV